MIIKSLVARKAPFLASIVGCALLNAVGAAQSGLNVTYGSKGVQTISYNGTVLEDAGSNPGDVFHIWHMKATNMDGSTNTTGQYGWGENNNGSSWNPATRTETYYFIWGSIATQFVQNGNNLDMIVTETNNPGSGVQFDGAEIYPFALHFPKDPVNFWGYTQYANTTTDPGVSIADYGSGVVTSVIPNESIPMYGGWQNQGGSTYSPFMTTTVPDGLATFLKANDYPIQPGTSLTYTVSLRFTNEGTAADASDAYSSFRATYPSQMTWTDKRIIGTAFLASSAGDGGSNTNSAAGWPTNPRRWENDPSIDITSAAGLRAFQNRMIQQAQTNVATIQQLGGQGLMTWDIEGEQYPQSSSYVCSPDQIAAVAPEMESIITDASTGYAGQKLDDAYFKIMVSAGLKVGVCIRPQVFTLNGNGTATQNYLNDNASVIANLENKIRVASTRWGVTMFYIDSSVNPLGGALDPAIFQQLITDFPNFLFIPEETNIRDYAYTAPFYSFIYHTTLGTPAIAYQAYPNAFGANLVNDVSPSMLAQYTPQLTASVIKGDILMGIGDFWQANDPALVAIYAAAGISKPTPVQNNPTVSWNAPAPIAYGTPLSAAQLNATANVAGTFIYSPSAGTMLPAGTDTITATFIPVDLVNYRSVTSSVTLQVNRVTPTISWAAPAAISADTPLSGTQLNATSNVPGTFTYSPAAGFQPSAGTTTLQVTFTPTDTSDYNTASASVNLTVKAAALATPQISWSTPAPITYGTQLSGMQLNASSNIGGNFYYNYGYGSILGAGYTVLQATFVPYDTNHYSNATANVTLQVLKATPVVYWNTPSAITVGTALSGAQLNASANVNGSFAYTPAAGVTLAVGTANLQVIFTPYDNNDYNTVTTSVPLTVNAVQAVAAPVAPVTPPDPSIPVAILSLSNGQTVSGQIIVQGRVNLNLDPAGSFLVIDGYVDWNSHRVISAPFLYPLDTTRLPNGTHTVQIWAHDIGNNTVLSAPITVTVQN